MTDRSGPRRDPSQRGEDSSSQSIVATLHCKVRIVRFSTMEGMEVPCPEEGVPDDAVAPRHAEADRASGAAARILGAQDDTRLAAFDLEIRGDDLGRNDAAIAASMVALPATMSSKARGDLVRERMNAAARPILESFARRRGMPLERLQEAIDAPRPLTHPEIVRRLGGALHSEDMRGVIAANADPALVPLKVRAGLAKMMAQDLSDPPPAAAREAFPDWNKPLAPMGRRLQSWRPQDAAAWLERFPPSEDLLHPLGTWDDPTAALWLNDRDTIPPGLPCEGGLVGTVVEFEPRDPWLPSLEVLHTLHELELEELTYRVFVERLRREVMPFYVSERRIHIRRAVELITFGYQTLKEARRSVREHDLRRIRYFDQVFGENHEWIYDLCCRIMATYGWPHGFAEPELRSDFPDLNEAPQ